MQPIDNLRSTSSVLFDKEAEKILHKIAKKLTKKHDQVTKW